MEILYLAVTCVKCIARKKNIYLRIVNSLTKQTPHAYVYDDKYNYGHAFLVSKILLQNDKNFVNETLKFINELDSFNVPKLNR